MTIPYAQISDFFVCDFPSSGAKELGSMSSGDIHCKLPFKDDVPATAPTSTSTRDIPKSHNNGWPSELTSILPFFRGL